MFCGKTQPGQKVEKIYKKIQIISLLGVPFFYSSLHGAMMPYE